MCDLPSIWGWGRGDWAGVNGDGIAWGGGVIGNDYRSECRSGPDLLHLEFGDERRAILCWGDCVGECDEHYLAEFSWGTGSESGGFKNSGEHVTFVDA